MIPKPFSLTEKVILFCGLAVLSTIVALGVVAMKDGITGSVTWLVIVSIGSLLLLLSGRGIGWVRVGGGMFTLSLLMFGYFLFYSFVLNFPHYLSYGADSRHYGCYGNPKYYQTMHSFEGTVMAFVTKNGQTYAIINFAADHIVAEQARFVLIEHIADSPRVGDVVAVPNITEHQMTAPFEEGRFHSVL